jgi:hypothetical protein
MQPLKHSPRQAKRIVVLLFIGVHFHGGELSAMSSSMIEKPHINKTLDSSARPLKGCLSESKEPFGASSVGSYLDRFIHGNWRQSQELRGKRRRAKAPSESVCCPRLLLQLEKPSPNRRHVLAKAGALAVTIEAHCASAHLQKKSIKAKRRELYRCFRR